MDFSADGRYLIASCEFSGQLLKVDVSGRARRPACSRLPDVARACRRTSSSRRTARSSTWPTWRRERRLEDLGARGSECSASSRPARAPTGSTRAATRELLYATNRGRGVDLGDQLRDAQGDQEVADPGRREPRHGQRLGERKGALGLRALNGVVYAIDTRTGRLIAKIPVGASPHGLSVWPQPGRYSLGHTGILR